MKQPLKIHRKKSMDSLENHGAGAKFHGFHGDISMLSYASMGQENCKNILLGCKTMENHGKHGNLQE